MERDSSPIRDLRMQEEALIIFQAVPKVPLGRAFLDHYLRSVASTETQGKETVSRPQASSSESRTSSTAKQSDLSSKKRRRRPKRSLDITEMERDRESDSHTLGDSTPKFLIVCFPGSDGYHMEHIRVKPYISDTELIGMVTAGYLKRRGAWVRLSRLRGFSGIRLARVS